MRSIDPQRDGAARILFLDDDFERCREFRAANPSAIIVHDASTCIAHLASGPWGLVFLDHDLGGVVFANPADGNTGSAVVRWVTEHRPQVGQFIVHSWNPRGNVMAKDLVAAGYSVVREMFGPRVVDWPIERRSLGLSNA